MSLYKPGIFSAIAFSEGVPNHLIKEHAKYLFTYYFRLIGT